MSQGWFIKCGRISCYWKLRLHRVKNRRRGEMRNISEGFVAAETSLRTIISVSHSDSPSCVWRGPPSLMGFRIKSISWNEIKSDQNSIFPSATHTGWRNLKFSRHVSSSWLCLSHVGLLSCRLHSGDWDQFHSVKAVWWKVLLFIESNCNFLHILTHGKPQL